VIVPILLGAVFGAGLLASWRLLFPAPPPLQAAIDRLQRRNTLASLPADVQGEGITDLLGRTVGVSIARQMRNMGFDMKSLEADLRMLGRSMEQHVAQKVLCAVFGFSLPLMLSLLALRTGIGFPVYLPFGGCLMLAALFFFVPDIAVRQEATERRDAFKHALGSFLDLVVISLAGGAGVESALRDAAAIGQGWAFAQLSNALEVTALTGETPWAVLGRLGAELGIPELEELSSSLSLAGTEGAKVRESLAVKAGSLREHALAEAEAKAASSTEKMAVPVVLLFLGFLILVGYPAVAAILNSV
jgi:tight adherence protein C